MHACTHARTGARTHATTHTLAAITQGDSLPSVTVYEKLPDDKVDLLALFKGKKVWRVGVHTLQRTLPASIQQSVRTLLLSSAGRV